MSYFHTVPNGRSEEKVQAEVTESHRLLKKRPVAFLILWAAEISTSGGVSVSFKYQAGEQAATLTTDKEGKTEIDGLYLEFVSYTTPQGASKVFISKL